MSTGLIKLIKQAALEAVESGQPTDLRYGVVTSTNPLKIQITQQFILPESVLIVPQRLTNHTVTVEVNWNTDTADNHTHNITGTKTITIKNALKTGDKVALIREKGGQSYFVLDRI